MAFEDQEEYVNKAKEGFPTQVIHVGKDRNESRFGCQKNCQ
jgi:hypothetical protein